MSDAAGQAGPAPRDVGAPTRRVVAEANRPRGRSRPRGLPTPAVWQVYAVLALAVSAFLVAVLLMATGVVSIPAAAAAA